MTLIRWTPRHSNPELARMQNHLDQMFDRFWDDRTPAQGASLTPPVDIEENPEHFVLRADLPGFKKEDLKVRVEGDTLTIHGERRLESESTQGTTHRRERLAGRFERSFALTVPVRAGDIKASYKDGVLEVVVPKAEEARAREIEVQLA